MNRIYDARLNKSVLHHTGIFVHLKNVGQSYFGTLRLSAEEAVYSDFHCHAEAQQPVQLLLLVSVLFQVLSHDKKVGLRLPWTFT